MAQQEIRFKPNAFFSFNKLLAARYGSLGLIKQGESLTYDPTRGWSKVMSWEGPYSRCKTWAKQLVTEWKEYGIDVAVSVTEDVGGSGRVEATLPADIDPVDTVQWSLDGNDLEKPIETHPMLANVRDEELELLRRVKANPQYRIQSWQSEMASSTPAQSIYITQNTNIILSLIKRGVEVLSISQYALKKSAIYSSYNTAQIAIANVGRQHFMADLINYEGLPTNIKFAMPSTGWWIKRTPKISTEGIRVKTETEFWHVDAASIWLYPYAVNPFPTP